MTNSPEAYVVEDLDKFVLLLADWHKQKVDLLQHMMEVPEGTEVSFNEEPAKPLEGDRHEGFRLGLSVALMELGNLPFAYEASKDDAPVH